MPFRVLSQGCQALLAAAAAPAFVAFAIGLLTTMQYGGPGIAFGLAVIVFLVAFAHAFILGLPAFALGYRLRKITLETCLLFGFLVGALPFSVAIIAVCIHSGNLREITGVFGVLFFYGGSGAIGGAACWAVLRRTLLRAPSAP